MKPIFSRKSKGFTLIELLIVIAIVGILIAIVVPSYQTHIQKANRVAAQLALTKLAQQFERTNARQGEYPTDDVNESTGAYDISVSGAEKTSFELIAEPIDEDYECGTLSINEAGVTKPVDCWN